MTKDVLIWTLNLLMFLSFMTFWIFRICTTFIRFCLYYNLWLSWAFRGDLALNSSIGMVFKGHLLNKTLYLFVRLSSANTLFSRPTSINIFCKTIIYQYSFYKVNIYQYYLQNWQLLVCFMRLPSTSILWFKMTPRIIWSTIF